MKTKWVATLNAGKPEVIFLFHKNLGRVILMSSLFLVFSCEKSDDLETTYNEPPEYNQSPGEDEPIDDEPVVEEPTNEESIIIYTDIEPDFTGDELNDSYDIDLNNDNILDFTVSWISDKDFQYLTISSASKFNNGVISVAPWYVHPVPLNANYKIFNNSTGNGEYYETGGIFTIGDCFGGETDCYSQWLGKGDKYLGLRFYIKGKVHYGWARMIVVSNTQWTIKDYAYNATPNKSILAGQEE